MVVIDVVTEDTSVEDTLEVAVVTADDDAVDEAVEDAVLDAVDEAVDATDVDAVVALHCATSPVPIASMRTFS